MRFGCSKKPHKQTIIIIIFLFSFITGSKESKCDGQDDRNVGIFLKFQVPTVVILCSTKKKKSFILIYFCSLIVPPMKSLLSLKAYNFSNLNLTPCITFVLWKTIPPPPKYHPTKNGYYRSFTEAKFKYILNKVLHFILFCLC